MILILFQEIASALTRSNEDTMGNFGCGGPSPLRNVTIRSER